MLGAAIECPTPPKDEILFHRYATTKRTAIKRPIKKSQISVIEARAFMGPQQAESPSRKILAQNVARHRTIA